MSNKLGIYHLLLLATYIQELLQKNLDKLNADAQQSATRTSALSIELESSKGKVNELSKTLESYRQQVRRVHGHLL